MSEAQPILKIIWVDSGMNYANGWLDEKTIIDRAKAWDGKVETVGRLAYEDDNILVVTQSFDLETEARAHAMLIYKPTILERIELTGKKNKPTK